MLELKEVSFTIRKDGADVPLVDQVSLRVPKGHFMAIVGPSGCGKTAEEAKQLGASDLTGDLGPLPPMKIHCGQLVEGALRNALDNAPAAEPSASNLAPTLASSLAQKPAGKLRIVPIE